MLSLDHIEHVYVSSTRRGFLAVADIPICVDNCAGSSGNNVIIGIKRVVRDGDAWAYADSNALPQYWLRKAWDEAVALKGGEPWRVYRLDAAEVATRLDAGESIDDVRGFENRLEPWQAIELDARGDKTGSALPAKADAWERVDGWRAVRMACGAWTADGGRCNADEAVLEHSPQHFDGLSGDWPSAAEAIRAVDGLRPWA